MNWVKELKIKTNDGVFNKDSRQWAFGVLLSFFSLKNSKMVIQFTTYCIKF